MTDEPEAVVEDSAGVTYRLRWDRPDEVDDDDVAAHGRVSVRVHDGPTTDVYRFDAVDRDRERYQREFVDGDRAEYGAQRARVTDGGPVAGLVVDFRDRRRLVHGRQQHATQSVPEDVARYLLDQGATAVGSLDD